MRRTGLLLLLMVVTLAGGAAAQEKTPALVVAYVDDGDLWLWQEGGAARRIAERDIQQPVLAPGGARVAFRRLGPEPGEELAVLDIESGVKRVSLTADAISTDAERRGVNQFAWADADTLYFNTVRVLPDTLFTIETDDLWRADATTGAVTQLLAPGDGGYFAVAPDGAHIAVTRPGRYGEADQPGTVSVFDAGGAGRVDVLSFPAVATGSEYRFYPIPSWLPDGSGFRVPIPDPEAVYGAGDAPPVALWEAPVGGPARQIGAAPADYFSVVFNDAFWSPDGAHIVYTQRAGAQEANRLALCIAASDGGDPACHDEVAVGAYAPLGWKPDGSAFAYRIDTAEATSMWLLTASGERQPFTGEAALDLAWVDADTYVYIVSVDAALALKYVRSGGAPQTIATTAGWPAFSAAQVE
ncbi:MAG: hypothetical protein Kow00120_30130 [Anaerolineae bacterium]